MKLLKPTMVTLGFTSIMDDILAFRNKEFSDILIFTTTIVCCHTPHSSLPELAANACIFLLFVISNSLLALLKN